jgi:hypothetical protein
VNLSDRLVSRIRTLVPALVGIAAGWIAAKTGIVIAPEDTALVVGLVMAGYYELVRRLEERWPALGWLLGAATEPTYGVQPTVSSSVTDYHDNGSIKQIQSVMTWPLGPDQGKTK